MARFTWIAVLASLVACGGGGSTPAPRGLAGHWAYAMDWKATELYAALSCTGEMTLTGPNSAVTGTWQDAECGDRPENVGSGTVTGWASDNGHWELEFVYRYQDEWGDWHEAHNTASGSFASATGLTGTFDGSPSDTMTATLIP